ncbi:nitrate- and nitrite sensing domain-containing protein [Actinomadura barringtoniae]|uniref:histidine kinase n=1 Tax=Actinomadura barringtoniae TaxID=1427535 RepID=A0A939PQY9_9ACTN|nr:sensor histidine kinase [Actinomadura barringtoniae]MBO2453136.1 nitrate- and nitrite sensing domain-containing protein [Actinomadura barringtoniae]
MALRNWRVPARLVALILIPTAVALVLGGLRIVSASDKADALSRVEKLAKLGSDVGALTHEFAYERDLSAGFIAAGRPASQRSRIKAQYDKVNDVASTVRASATDLGKEYGGVVQEETRAITNRLDGFSALRSLTDARVPVASVVDKYSEFQSELIAYFDGIAEGVADQDLTEDVRALSALSHAKEEASRERAVLYASLVEGRMDDNELNQLFDARAKRDGFIAAFQNAAPLSERQSFDDTVTGREVDQASEYIERAIAISTGRTATAARLDIDPNTTHDAEAWRKVSTATVDQMRISEKHLMDHITSDTVEKRDDARNAMYVQIAVVAAVLLLVLLLTFIVARSLVGPLRRLRAGALEIAGARLPGLVDRLRDPEAAAGGIEVEPIEIASTDEIGQVARAFDEVHREAVRLAADEAVLRGNINAMFVNLSRRSQTLIEGQLRLIEKLEQSERDEEQLANLFRLDHLATRMRRNCENLLVLGGQDQVRRWNRPVPLIDVVRASLSEVEQYERVALRVQGDMTVAGAAVNDLVHLLAELVENATVFSSESTKVTVSGQLLSGGGAMLQITDNGVGMPPEELEQANWRLANPPVIDFSAARRMGLFVVGRLAVRHGIRVELRAAQGGGLTAFVVLPDAVVSPGESGGVGSRNFGGGHYDELEVGQGHAAVAAPATRSEQPAIGMGGVFQADPNGRPSPHDPRPVLPEARPSMHENGTGPLPSLRDQGRGSFQNTGPQPRFGQTGPQPAISSNDAGTTGPLPIRMPGAQLPNRSTSGGDLFADNSSQSGQYQPGNNNTGPIPPVPPRGMGNTGPIPTMPPGAGNTGPIPAVPPNVGNTGPLPVVPEAQPAVRETPPPPPEPNRRPVSWDSGPLPETHWPEPAEPPRSPMADTGASGHTGTHGHTGGYGHSEAARQTPAPESFRLEEPSLDQRAPQPNHAEPQARPRERSSPIFDAMQSEWFQRRSGGAGMEDPVKGWQSPADAGFQAAEALREPVAGKTTQAGLPKRVPGKNRVPGAVAASQPQAGGPGAPGAQQGPPGAGRGAPGMPMAPPGGAEAPAPRQAQSADVVRNRFASLQRGVTRGRTQSPYEPGQTGSSTGEGPSQGGGETGGTR